MFLFSCRQWKSPLLHGLPVLPALYDLLDDIWLHLMWVIEEFCPASTRNRFPSLLSHGDVFPQTGGSTVPPVTPRMVSGSTWPRSPRALPGCSGCSLTASSISCGWPFSSCVSSTRFVPLSASASQMCWVVIDTMCIKAWGWPLCLGLVQIAALGITTNERMNARRYKHFKVTATSIESPFK